jgi:hypothetical protein
MNDELARPRRKDARLAIVGVTVALAVLGSAPAAWSGSSSAAATRGAKPLLKLTARIRVIEVGSPGTLTPVRVFFSPSVINVGTVIIVARNSDPQVAHKLAINGVTSKPMGPDGGTAVMKVTFKRPGTYLVQVFGGIGDGQDNGSGELKVLK